MHQNLLLILFLYIDTSVKYLWLVGSITSNNLNNAYLIVLNNQNSYQEFFIAQIVPSNTIFKS